MGVRHRIRHAEIGQGEDAEHPGKRLRLGGVDTTDEGVGLGATDEGDVGEPREVEIVDVATVAGDEPGILPAAHPSPDCPAFTLSHGRQSTDDESPPTTLR